MTYIFCLEKQSTINSNCFKCSYDILLNMLQKMREEKKELFQHCTAVLKEGEHNRKFSIGFSQMFSDK